MPQGPVKWLVASRRQRQGAGPQRRRSGGGRPLPARLGRGLRERMVGRTLSGVTLHGTGTALTENYLKVELAGYREPNELVDLRIGGVTGGGLWEAANPQ